jgi:hypothetical protein
MRITQQMGVFRQPPSHKKGGLMSDRYCMDPSVFDPEKISPETARFNRGVENTLRGLLPTYTLPPQKLRDDREAGKGLWPVNRRD